MIVQIVAILIATATPLVFLYIIYALDLYASRSFRTVVVCFAWGLMSFFLAYLANSTAGAVVSMILLVTVVAPILEEFLKSLSLAYYARGPDFTYFVDGAIYGFASGIAFSIFENFLYLFQSSEGGGLLIVIRSFSTCLMHGSASALVGIAIGRLRFGRGATRIASLFLGWGSAIVLHAAFNHVVTYTSGLVALVGALGIGLGGVGLIAIFIQWGLWQERQWIEETLGIDLGVTESEVKAVGQLADLEELLSPIAVRFGEDKAWMVQEFLLKQAQLGIKEKSRAMAKDAKLRTDLEAQVQRLHAEMEELRRAVGVYCMAYVRSIFPVESIVLWSSLEAALQEQEGKEVTFDIWRKLEETPEAEG